MRGWIAGICLFLVSAGFAVSAFAQEDEASWANSLYIAGKRLEALPLYEALAPAYPNEWLYAERLADCLGAKAAQTSDPAKAKILRTRERDAAKRALALGDPNYFVQLMAKIDPDAPLFRAESS